MHRLGPLALVVISACTAAESAERRTRGPVFTTTSSGTRIDGNQFTTRSSVYLDGGPHGVATAALPAGDYVFQVTDATGKQLLSTDHISCRRFTVGDDGLIVQAQLGTTYDRIDGSWNASHCRHRTGVDREYGSLGAVTVQLMPYRETPSGVYQVWVTAVADYTGNVNFVPTPDDDSLDDVGFAEWTAHGFVQVRSRVDSFVVKR